MIKKYYLLPVFALSLAGLALTGCDDKKDNTAGTETTAESSVPSAGTAMTETAAIDQMEQAEDTDVHVSAAYAFATAQTAANGAVFASLHNTSTSADTLLSAKSDVAESVELHQTYMDPQTNTMLMRRTSAIDIAAGQTLKLEPSSFHIMLIGLKQPLVQDEKFNVTLNFRKAGEIVVPVTITAPGDMDAGAAMDDHSSHGAATTVPSEETAPDTSYVPPAEDESAQETVETPAPADAPTGTEVETDGSTVTE